GDHSSAGAQTERGWAGRAAARSGARYRRDYAGDTRPGEHLPGVVHGLLLHELEAPERVVARGLEMGTREHRGLALSALGAVALVTAAWWVLALYPAATAPEWMVRTRYVCFGAPPGGLPNAGGWILLAGQPIGMLVMLFAGWGNAVVRDVRWFGSRMPGR